MKYLFGIKHEILSDGFSVTTYLFSLRIHFKHLSAWRSVMQDPEIETWRIAHKRQSEASSPTSHLPDVGFLFVLQVSAWNSADDTADDEDPADSVPSFPLCSNRLPFFGRGYLLRWRNTCEPGLLACWCVYQTQTSDISEAAAKPKLFFIQEATKFPLVAIYGFNLSEWFYSSKAHECKPFCQPSFKP